MGRVFVKGAEIDEGRVARLRVALHGLPERVLDRDEAVAWMKDGHSLLPVVDGSILPALLLLEDGSGGFVIRMDTEATDADALPSLPAV